MAGEFAGDNTPELLSLVHDITGMCVGGGGSSSLPADAMFRKDCTDLVRRISLLSHLFEEIKELNKIKGSPSSSSSIALEDSWSSDLVLALQSAKRLLSIAKDFSSNSDNSSVSFRSDARFFVCDFCFSNLDL
jgi:hypothetical protein